MLSNARGLGTDMATLDTAYFCSQVLLLTFMGYIVHITGTAAMYLVTSAVLSGISCYFIYTAVYTEADMPKFNHIHNSDNPTIVINNNSILL